MALGFRAFGFRVGFARNCQSACRDLIAALGHPSFLRLVNNGVP